MEKLNMLPTWDDILSKAPNEIKNILKACENTPQSPKWHPEAPNEKVPHNVLAHIKIVFNRARKSDDINLVLAATFHDLGKMETLKLNKKGGWSNYGHEAVSSKLVKKYSDWIESIGGDSIKVYNIVKEHMRIKRFNEMRPIKQKQLSQNPYFDKIKQFTKFDDMTTLTDEERNLDFTL